MAKNKYGYEGNYIPYKKFPKGWLDGEKHYFAYALEKNTPSDKKRRFRLYEPKSYTITSTFCNRKDPGTKEIRPHYGNDISVPTGTEIRAPFDGTVERRYDKGGYGNYIILTPDDKNIGFSFIFAHLDKIVQTKTRASVKTGDIIGYTGNSGRSFGAHLHLEAFVKGTINEPLKNHQFKVDSKNFISDEWIFKGTERRLCYADEQSPYIDDIAKDISEDGKFDSEKYEKHKYRDVFYTQEKERHVIVGEYPIYGFIGNKLTANFFWGIKRYEERVSENKWEKICVKDNAVVYIPLEEINKSNKRIEETDWSKSESKTSSVNKTSSVSKTDEKNKDEEQTKKIDYEVKEKLVPGIWQIMKLIIDGDVSHLRVSDASTSFQQGSLINFFQKVCQQPFVEFFGDTYGDQYYFITRRPPFDKEGMKKTMVAQGLFAEDGYVKINPAGFERYDFEDDVESPYDVDFRKGGVADRGTIYDIYEDDIVSSNVTLNNQNIYSWYQFVPVYEHGANDNYKYLIPAILFPEYAAIWGSRSLNITSQYRDFRSTRLLDKVKNGEKSQIGDIVTKDVVHDMKYLIECNAYNPFVRQGTITILGNRKIKRGTFIRVFWNSLSCPEVFYVENVSQNYSVNTGGVSRTTTLTLSHGMLADYMFDDTEESVKISYDDSKKRTTMSYFNIIDFGDYEKYKNELSLDKWREVVKGWKVNTTVFLFFLRKTQFLSKMSDKNITIVRNK